MAIDVPTAGALPPSFVRLAGHPLRWRLLRELGRSDRQVRELCGLVNQPQSLVSYHLARLRREGYVATRRSAADGRDAYYSLDLTRCRDAFVDTGTQLHPGLRLEPAATNRTRDVGPAGWRMLFLCTGNSARSQIAEAMVQQLTDGTIEAFSAGSEPKPLHPNAIRVMRERGLDVAGRRSKHLNEFTSERLDHVISLCDRVRERCPGFPGGPERIHWSIPNPAAAGRSDDQTYPAFQRTAAELAERIPFLLELIATRASRRLSDG